MKRHKEALHRAWKDGFLVRISRHHSLPSYKVDGFVVGLGKRWVLLHLVNGDSLHLDGYAAIRVKDVVKLSHDRSFAARALELRGEYPTSQPDILLTDLPGLLSSVNAHFPLVNIQLEKVLPDTCYIGRIEQLTAKRVTLNEVDAKARWKRTRRYRLKDITYVAFASGYEEALWMVVEDDRRAEQEAETPYE